MIDRKLGTLHELETGTALSADEVIARVQQKAWVLKEFGVERGHRVTLAHGNSIEFFCDLLAVWSLGASAVPLHHELATPELEEVLTLTGSSLLLTRKQNLRGLSPKILHTQEDFKTSQLHTSWTWPEPQDECLVLLSSGTSRGRAKCIRHSWAGLSHRLEAIRRHLGPRPPQRVLCLLPTSFGHGLLANCLASWLKGADLFLLPSFNPFQASELGHLLNQERVEFFSTVPYMWRVLQRWSSSRPQLDSLRRVHCASAPLDVQTHGFMRDWCQGASTCNVYGLTEAGSWMAGTKLSGALPHDGYIGEVWGGEVAILRGGVFTREPRAIGEICLRTPSLMLGYLGEQDPVLSDRFFPTGDLGWLDPQGHLTLTGRLSDVINKGGAKISPAEVQRVLESHAQVRQAWVTRVPDRFWGEVVGAVVVPRTPERFSLAELKSWCRENLAALKQPTLWATCTELPLTARGKVDRARILTLLDSSVAQGAAAVDGERSSRDITRGL